MELLTLLKEFGLIGVYIGIMFYLIKMQDKTNADREMRFVEERTRWQTRDSEWLSKVLLVLQGNSDVMIRFATGLEQTNRMLAELITLTHSHDAQTQFIANQLMRFDPQIIELTKVMDKLIEEVYTLRQNIPQTT